MTDETKHWTFLLNPRELAVGLATEQRVLKISTPITSEEVHEIYAALAYVRELGRNEMQVVVRERARDRGAYPYQPDTNQYLDSQRFRYGFGNDEKVVDDNYYHNVTDAGDTPQTATTWVRSPLQSGEVDTPIAEQTEHINQDNTTVSPSSTLQNRQETK